MLRILSVAVALGLLAAPARAGDGQTYKIKIKKPGEGTVERVVKTEDTTTKVKLADNCGNVMQDKEEKTGHNYVYTLTVLEKKAGAKKPTRLKRKYEKAAVIVDGETKTLPYEGKTVLIEKKDDKYTFRIEGGDELSEDDAKQLNKEFNKKRKDDDVMEKLLLPKKAVKLNEEWKVDSVELAKGAKEEGALELDPEKTTVTGKLIRVYKKGGKQFGVLVYKLKLGLKAIYDGDKRIAVEGNSVLTGDVKIDACIDGTSTTGHVTTNLAAQIEALLPDPANPMFRLSVNSRGKETNNSVEK
jgi:hypothetical protein